MRKCLLILNTFVMLCGIVTSLNQPPKTPEHRLKPSLMSSVDLNERLAPKRASRASSELLIASVSTTITTQVAVVKVTSLPIIQKPKSPHPVITAPKPVTVSETTDYDICFNAGAQVKGKKAAPNIARWVDLVSKYFPGEIFHACYVMARESGGEPNAVGPRQPNGSYPHGLMQILNGPFDPEANMQLAASMRAKRGWQPWGM